MVFAFLVFAFGCAAHRKVPVIEYGFDTKVGKGPSEYKVEKGDTLYSIVWRYGKNFKEIAELNGLGPPYMIYPGQTIYFVSNSRSLNKKTKKRYSRAVVKHSIKVKESTKNPPVRRAQTITFTRGKINWQWPVDGAVIAKFLESGIGNKGLDISAKKGDAVLAAAAGRVVYSGSHLVGYGKLVIIKHNDDYLSAYAHNSKLLVEEGMRVDLRQKIAEVGSTGANREKLHFEIRYKGRPIDPERLLPLRNQEGS